MGRLKRRIPAEDLIILDRVLTSLGDIIDKEDNSNRINNIIKEEVDNQFTLETLYKTCLALEYDNRYLYTLLTRTDQKLEGQEVHLTRQDRLSRLYIREIKSAQETIRRLLKLLSRIVIFNLSLK